MVIDWQNHGVIRLRAKIWSTLLSVPLFTYTLVFVAGPLAVKAILVLVACGVWLFIWSRPSSPRGSSQSTREAAGS